MQVSKIVCIIACWKLRFPQQKLIFIITKKTMQNLEQTNIYSIITKLHYELFQMMHEIKKKTISKLFTKNFYVPVVLTSKKYWRWNFLSCKQWKLTFFATWKDDLVGVYLKKLMSLFFVLLLFVKFTFPLFIFFAQPQRLLTAINLATMKASHENHYL